MRKRSVVDLLGRRESIAEDNAQEVRQGSIYMNQGHSVEKMIITPEDKIYTIEADAAVRVYDLETGITDALSKRLKAVLVKIEPEALFILTGDNTVVAWSTENHNYYVTFKGHSKWITAYQVHDQMLYTASADGTLRAWDAFLESSDDLEKAGGKESNGPRVKKKDLTKFFGATKGVEYLNQIPGVRMNAVFVGTGRSGPKIELERTSKLTFQGHEDIVTCMTLHNGVLYSASTDCTARSWNPKRGTCLKVFEGHTDWIYTLLVEDEILYCGSRDTTIRTWNIRTGRRLQIIRVGQSVTSLKLKNKTLFAMTAEGSGKCTIRSFSSVNGKRMATFEGHTGKIRAIKFFEGRMFTAGDDNTIREWNSKTGQCLNIYRGHTGSVTAICIKGGDTLFSASHDGTIRTWAITKQEDKEAISHKSVSAYVPLRSVSGSIAERTASFSATFLFQRRSQSVGGIRQQERRAWRRSIGSELASPFPQHEPTKRRDKKKTQKKKERHRNRTLSHPTVAPKQESNECTSAT
ncbi:hypothetical protein QOT17_023143 [Balamuthia mandrillaris]